MPCNKLFLSSILVFVLLSFPIINSVGASSEMWSQTYGGTERDEAHSLVETSDGGFALAGYTGPYLAEDFWLVKTDAYRNLEWTQTHEGAAHSLVEVSGGGFVLADYASFFGSRFNDFGLIKTDEYGIPEFPSWIILPLFLTVTLVVAIYRRKLSKTSNHHSY